LIPTRYVTTLLNPSHSEGASKAQFLQKMGYEQQNFQLLEMDLRNQHLKSEALPGKKSIYGTKYEIVAPLTGPNRKTRWVRSIWMIRFGESVARFVTLIPEKQP